MFRQTATSQTFNTPEDPQWYGIRTRPRHEKRVALQLREKGIVAYLPVLNELHHWSDRRASVDVPLFPCYSFVRVSNSLDARSVVLRTPGVIEFLGRPGHPIPIPEKQIADIQTALTRNATCGRYPFLRVGQRVRVRGGSLDRIEGILLELRGNRSVVISVEPILQSLAICIEGYEIEILSVPQSNAA